MSIKVGDRIPEGYFSQMSGEGPVTIDISTYFANRKIVLFSVPGAFTPTCSNNHLPGFIQNHVKLIELGIDAIACTAVNDVFVMHAWGLSVRAKSIDMLADGNGSFVRSIGLEMDSTAFEMGYRGRRFTLIADNAIVTHLFIDAPGEFKLSSAEHMLMVLSGNSSADRQTNTILNTTAR